jgi:hypothetical protein
MTNGHGCTVRSEAFETDVTTDRRCPHISPVCKCTLCKACVDGSPAQTEHTVGCPLCQEPRAWNKRKLVPNRHLANLLHDMKRVLTNAGKDECRGGGSDCSDGDNESILGRKENGNNGGERDGHSKNKTNGVP